LSDLKSPNENRRHCCHNPRGCRSASADGNPTSDAVARGPFPIFGVASTAIVGETDADAEPCGASSPQRNFAIAFSFSKNIGSPASGSESSPSSLSRTKTQ
jgi:aspartate/tyrosine/aromatic aminotransferase